MDLSQLPSPFYRVTAKAIIFDDRNRLLVGKAGDGWEMSGGGWEHNESLEDCLKRELKEELGIESAKIGPIKFVYRGKSSRGWMIVRVAVEVKIEDHSFTYGDMKEAKFVDREELLNLDFAADEGTIKDNVELIWPTVN